MELASASTSTAVPAARHRGPVAALIAAVIVAAALLFAMPSLAYASSEAGGSQQAAESQEILLSSKGSSTSVSKTPDEPKTPPAYTQQDAYKSTPQSTGSGVDSVTGAGDSATNSYTPGDDKSSINDKDSDSDSDVASDPSISGTKDTDDSTPNEGDDTSDSNKGNDSTADSNGASSGSTDEIATDTNQSAHPTGSDSKADDVIATPGDRESADQNAGTTSDKTEEVYGPKTPADVKVPTETAPSNTIGTASDNITTQAASPGITIHFNQSLTNYKSRYDDGTVPEFGPNEGTDLDPVFCNSAFFTRANEPVTIPAGTLSSTTTFSTAYGSGFKISDLTATGKKIKKYGCNISNWYIVGFDSTEGIWRGFSVSSAWTSGAFATQYKKANFGQWAAYPVWSAQSTITVEFQNTNQNGNIKISDQSVSYTDTINFVTCPDATYPAPANYVYYSKAKDPGQTTPITSAGMRYCDYLDALYNIYTSTAAFNSTIWGSFTLQATEVKEEISFTVTFNNGGGTGAAQTFTYTDSGAFATANGTATGTKPEASFSRTGYDFLGWSTTNGATTAAIGSAGLLSTAVGTPTNGGTYTLYAVWGPKTYTITYSAGSGVTGVTVPSAGSATHGSNYTVSSTTPTRTG